MTAPAGPPPVRTRRSGLGWRIGLLVGALLVVTAGILTALSVITISGALTDAAGESMRSSHRSVADLVETSSEGIAAYRASELAARKSELADLSAAVVIAMDALRSQMLAGGATEEEAKAAVLTMLRGIRYRNDDYFFALDRDLVMIEHPSPEFNGLPVADYRDANGKLLFREMRDVADRDGSGYVDYAWARLGETEPRPKITYVERYAPWDWVIGTGVYVDDIDAVAAERMADTEARLAQTFAQISPGERGFFLILDMTGRTVVAPAGREDEEVFLAAGETRMRSEVLAMVEALPADGTASARMEVEAAVGDTPPEGWLVELSRFADPAWILVSAVPIAELRAPGIGLALQQLALSVLILLVGLAIGLLSSRRIVGPVTEMTDAAIALEEDRFEPAMLDRAAARTDELGALARAFRRMGTEVVERERALRERIAGLVVTIDRGRVEREVGEITESDFFLDLQARARAMRARDGAPPEEGPPT